MLNHFFINLANNIHNFQSSTSDLNKIKEALFPNLPIFFAHLIASLFLIFIIIRFAYIPFKKMEEKKNNYLQQLILDANKKLVKVFQKEEKLKIEIEKTFKKRDKIINDANLSVFHERNKILAECEKKKKQIIKNGLRELEYETSKINDLFYQSIIDNAFLIAEKLVKHDMKNKSNTELVNNFINELKEFKNNDNKK